jgi:hypothetical protein
MKKRTYLLVTSVAIGSLILTGCGKSSEGSNTTSGDATELTENAAATTTGAFGSALTIGSDATLLIGAPAAFTPTVFASNYQQGWKANRLEVTITNNGTAPLETSSIAFATTSGANVCTDILDGDNDINGAPTTALAAGASETFTIGVGCDAKAGDPLEVKATIGSVVVAATGKLA